MNPVTLQVMDSSNPMNLSGDGVENTILAIQSALNKSRQKPKI